MPIDNINNISSISPQARRLNERYQSSSAQNPSTDTRNDVPRQDSVSLTDSAQKLKTLEEKVSRLPIIDTQKVEHIKTAINNGSYDFNPQRIAEKMIDFEKQLY